MNKTMINKLCAGVILTTLALHANADVTDNVEKSFNVDANSHFSLDNVNGSVDISSWDQQVIKVSATVKADNQQDRDRITIDMQQNNKGVSVDTRYKNDSSWGSNHNTGSVSYTIMVPQDIDLTDIDLVNGSLSINNVHGEVNAELVNGSIDASGLTTNSKISSVNGHINIRYQKLNSKFEQVKLETVNGTIKIYLPEHISASVQAETMHGIIQNDFGLKTEKNTFLGRNLRGDIGSGDAKISLESVNGSISILKD